MLCPVNIPRATDVYDLTVKLPVRVATAAALTLATGVENGDTIDGVVIATGDRVLVKDQATASENGIYTVNASGAPTRALDLNTGAAAAGVRVVVNEGTVNADTMWGCTTNSGSDVVGTNNLAFAFAGKAETPTNGKVQIGSTGAVPSWATLTAGLGMSITNAAGAITLATALGWRLPVRVATTANGTLATAFANGQTVDGVTLATGDRILLKDQSTGAENGIYTVNSAGAPTRSADMAAASSAASAAVYVQAGTVNATTIWTCTNLVGSDVVATNQLTFRWTAVASTPSAGTLLLGTSTVPTWTALSSANNGLAISGLTFTSKVPSFGVLNGLTCSNNVGDASNDIDVAAGMAISSDGTAFMTLSAGLTKRLDAAWAAGTNQGGLDTGSEATSTWYHIWLIAKADGTTDVLYSTSASSPTMPSGYTLKSLIMSFYNDSGSTIRPFVQYGNTVIWKVPPADVDSGTNPGTSTLTGTLLTPLGIVTEAIQSWRITGVATASSLIVRPLSITDSAPTLTGEPGADARMNSAQDGRITLRTMTNTSSQVGYRASASDADTRIFAWTKGFVHPRGATW